MDEGIIQPYLNYLGFLLMGVFVVDMVVPNLNNAGVFDKFLLAGAKIYTGALVGSCVYKLSLQKFQRCTCCNDNDSDSGNSSE